MGLLQYGCFLLLGTAALNLIFSIIIGNLWGLFGILFATFLSRLFTNLWYDPYVIYKHAFGRNPVEYVKKYIIYILVLIAEVVICYYLTQWIQASLVSKIVLKAAVVSIICNVVFYMIFRKTSEFAYLCQITKKAKTLILRVISRK